MKLPFEKWLESEVEISNERQIKDVFDDAILCFKNGIYRPALHLSFIGFLFVTRNRILLMKRPDAYTEGEWNQLQIDLKNDRIWEETILDKLNQCASNDKSLFSLSDDIRNQIIYWKNRRNDCAHYKNNIISESDIVVFWNFLESRLPIIAAKGGILDIKEKISRFYDFRYTSPNQTITPLIESIEKIISENNYEEIFEHIYNESLLVDKYSVPYFNSNKIQPFLIQYFHKNKYLLYDFLSFEPAKVYSLIKKEDVRSFWYKEIPTNNSLQRVSFALYAEMISCAMIREQDKEESIKYLLKLFLTNQFSIDFSILKEREVSILRDNGLFDIFVSEFCSVDYFSHYYNIIHRKYKWRYMELIEIMGLNQGLVEVICNNFNEGFYPWSLQERLKLYINSNDDIKKEFYKLVEELNFTAPYWLEITS